MRCRVPECGWFRWAMGERDVDWSYADEYIICVRRGRAGAVFGCRARKLTAEVRVARGPSS